MFCSYTAMAKVATPTSDPLPHLSSVGTTVKCYAPSPPYSPVGNAQPVVTSSSVPVSSAPVAPGYPCMYVMEQFVMVVGYLLNNIGTTFSCL